MLELFELYDQARKEKFYRITEEQNGSRVKLELVTE